MWLDAIQQCLFSKRLTDPYCCTRKTWHMWDIKHAFHTHKYILFYGHSKFWGQRSVDRQREGWTNGGTHNWVSAIQSGEMAWGKRQPCNLALNIVPVSQLTNSDFNRRDCSGCACRCTKNSQNYDLHWR